MSERQRRYMSAIQNEDFTGFDRDELIAMIVRLYLRATTTRVGPSDRWNKQKLCAVCWLDYDPQIVKMYKIDDNPTAYPDHVCFFCNTE